VSSEYAQQRKGFKVERLDRFDRRENGWMEILVEDRRSGPAEIVASRMDFAAWLRSLPKRDRKMAVTLASGETTGEAAKRFGVSPSRISQVRRQLQQSWDDSAPDLDYSRGMPAHDCEADCGSASRRLASGGRGESAFFVYPAGPVTYS
jgi:hypothetical protein